MKKSDKKLENALIKTLTTVCEPALDNVPGFVWLTHVVNYADVPNSLIVILVFKTIDDRAQAEKNQHDLQLIKETKKALSNINITLKNPQKQIKFDTEEACDLEHNGNWALRLS